MLGQKLRLRTCTLAFGLRFFGDALETGELFLSDLFPMFAQKGRMSLVVVFWTVHCSQLIKLANSFSTPSIVTVSFLQQPVAIGSLPG